MLRLNSLAGLRRTAPCAFFGSKAKNDMSNMQVARYKKAREMGISIDALGEDDSGDARNDGLDGAQDRQAVGKLKNFLGHVYSHKATNVVDERDAETKAFEDAYEFRMSKLVKKQSDFQGRMFTGRLYRKWEAINLLPNELRVKALTPEPDNVFPKTLINPTEFPAIENAEYLATQFNDESIDNAER